MDRDFIREYFTDAGANPFAWLAWVPIEIVATLLILGVLRLFAPKHDEGLHWSENARRLHAHRADQRFVIVYLCVWQVGWFLLALTPKPAGLYQGALILGVALGVMLAGRLYSPRPPRGKVVEPPDRLGRLPIVVIAGLHLVGAVWFAFSWPHFGREVLTLPAFFLFVVWYPLGGNLWLARTLKWAEPLAPELEAQLKEKLGAGIRLFALRSTVANAFALFLRPTNAIVVTSSALRLLDVGELRAIVMHEAGHLLAPRRIVVATTLGAVAAVSCLAFSPWVFFYWRVRGLVAMLALLVSLLLILQRLRRNEEIKADEHAAKIDASAYARALEKIYEYNGIPAVLTGNGGVHGHLYDRLVAAGASPAYPRPLPPRRRPVLALVMILLISCAHLASVTLFPHRVDLFGVTVDSLERKAERAFAKHRYDRALVLYGAREQAGPRDIRTLSNLVIAASYARDCDLSSAAYENLLARVSGVEDRSRADLKGSGGLFRAVVEDLSKLANPASSESEATLMSKALDANERCATLGVSQ